MPGGLGRRLGRGQRDLELLGGLLARLADDAVRLEQTLASGAQLLDLLARLAPAAGEVLQDPLAHDLRFGDHLASGGLARLDLGGGVGCGQRAQLVGLLGDRRGGRVGLGRALLEERVGFAPHADGFLLALAHEARGFGLGPGTQLGGGLARRLEDARDLVAERGGQAGIVDDAGLLGGPLGVGEARLELEHPLVGGAQLRSRS